jgi:glutamate synthase domain-containing protein 3
MIRMQVLDAKNIRFRELNQSIRNMLGSGQEELHLKNVAGQRYIANGLSGNHRIFIEGIPGNDMAAYMDGPEVIVKGNAQDAIGNTMNRGRVIVHGNAGDTAGYAMRDGEIYIRGNTGYRVGIHMKEYNSKKPVIVIGGSAGDFLGEYMAGGTIIVLGLDIGEGEEIAGNFCGTGMHGGKIYIRGHIEPHRLGKEVSAVEADIFDMESIKEYIERFSQYFEVDCGFIMDKKFTKLYACNKRPYGNLYTH